ncbi:MAG: DUF2550 family protein [Ancrocorticia sp.]
MNADVLIRLALIAAAIALFGGLALLGRYIILARIPGALPCAMRRPDHKWHTGILILGAHDLRWYRTGSLLLGPRRVISRRSFEILAHRPSEQNQDTRVIEVKDGEQPLVIAMNSGGFAGLVSWSDSAPPGVEYVGY